MGSGEGKPTPQNDAFGAGDMQGINVHCVAYPASRPQFGKSALISVEELVFL